MTPQDRVDACQMLAADKRRLGLPVDEVQRIDAVLAEKWGIAMPLLTEQWGDRLAELIDLEITGIRGSAHKPPAASAFFLTCKHQVAPQVQQNTGLPNTRGLYLHICLHVFTSIGLSFEPSKWHLL
jgi:hypothetical protein